MPAALQPISLPNLRSHQCSIVKRRFRPPAYLPASAKSPHSSPPSTPTVSLVSSLPNGQITRPCKRPSRSGWCSAPCNWPNKPYTTTSKPVDWIPMPFAAYPDQGLADGRSEMRNGPKIAHIKVFLAPIPSPPDKLSRIGEILLANVAGVLQPLMCACLGCEVATSSSSPSGSNGRFFLPFFAFADWLRSGTS
jgi:hypothetical protein